MTPERYQQVYEIFSSAQELPFEQRAEFLNEACEGDEELRSEVEAYLESDENIGDFIKSPALEVAAKIIADEQSTSKIGLEVGHYKIISLLGVGGMGEVWLAEDVRLRRKVAIKILSAQHKNESLARFEQEARVVSSLNHPNIITIYDIGQSADGWEYIATEYIDGKTLRQLISENSLDTIQSIKITTQIASALTAAHAAGIIHRDIKPENIMLRADGIVKVLDFGLARFTDKNISNLNEKLKTAPGTVMGTVTYMSPEQARGHAVDDKTDVFSLGIVFYEMLTGNQPFEGESGMDVIAAILKYEPQPLHDNYPFALRQLIAQTLKKDSAERCSAAEFLNELRSINPQNDLVETERASGANGERNAQQTIPLTALTGDNRRRITDSFAVLGKRFSPKIIAGMALLLTTLAVVSGFALYRFRSQSALKSAILTKKDKLLIGAFKNSTGDADFDITLHYAFMTGVQQTPFLRMVSVQDQEKALKEMGKSLTDRRSIEADNELGRRTKAKVILKNTIENYQDHYLIRFVALNPEDGAIVAESQREAINKQNVIDSLGEALADMRLKLGEPPESVQKFNTPLSKAQSGSLAALKLYSLGKVAEAGEKDADAMVSYKQAIELDPGYASAYHALGVIHSNIGETTTARSYFEKAFSLPDRMTEADRFDLETFYYDFVTGESEKAIERYEAARKEFPNDDTNTTNAGVIYLELGNLTKAEEYARLVLRQIPSDKMSYFNLAEALIYQSRFEEAKATYEEGFKYGLGRDQTALGLYTSAFALNETDKMRQQIEFSKTFDEAETFMLEGHPLIFNGKAAEYQKMMNKAAESAAEDAPEVAAEYSSKTALNLAAVGMCSEAQTWSNRALNYDRERVVLTNTAMIFAVCGKDPQSLITELKKDYPKDTIVNRVWLPLIQAFVEVKNSPEQALETLEANRQYEALTFFWGNFLRGKIYLQTGKPDLARREFEKILANRGWAVESPLYTLAYPYLSQALEQQNDPVNAKKYSIQFSALWKNADKNLPVLKTIPNTQPLN